MTNEHDDPPPEGHLDLEAASAALDGEPTADEAAHLGGCATCRTTVAELRAVQAVVAARPPLVPAVVREATISAALDAFAEGAGDEGAGGRTSDPAAAVPDLRDRRRSRPRFEAGPWLGVAAVLLLLVLAVPIITSGGGSDDDDDVAATSDAADESAGEESAALAAPDEGFTDVGDLGVLDAGADLRSVVDQALGARASASAPVAEEGAEPTAGDDGAAGDAAAGGAGAGAGAEAEQELQAAAGSPSREAAEACIEPVRAELGDLGALVLAGTATVDAEPALVLGFDAVDAERPTVIVVLVAAETCRLVTFQSYATG